MEKTGPPPSGCGRLAVMFFVGGENLAPYAGACVLFVDRERTFPYIYFN